MSDLTAYIAASVFDGARMHDRAALLVCGARAEGVVAQADIPADTAITDLGEGLLSPGYVDLQVNGGGGVMFNDDPSVATLATMAQAHAGIGATSILPTLITDTPDQSRAAIDAVDFAIAAGTPGIIGLHLEGPHLSQARKGAHDPALIRPMGDADVQMLLDAARRLPILMMTLAPESVTTDQIRALTNAGVILSLGHSDASFAACLAAAKAGVTCVTHLFNAMSQLTNREPGLVGAALALGGLSAGMIADTIHVHPQTMATALRAKQGPGRIYLVSDAMATAGSDIEGFTLNDRWIAREGDRLTLADGTLAGAHLELTNALRNIVDATGTPLDQALEMATSVPAGVIGKPETLGCLHPGAQADFVHLSAEMTLTRVWQGGAEQTG